MKRLALAAMLSIIAGLLTCGCMWGHVYDANTGDEVPGATILWVDAKGWNSGSMTTGLFWAPGLYVFDCKVGDVSHYNPATFTITAPGYSPLVVQREILYDDNPNATFDDCSSFWDINDFYLVPLPPTSGLAPHTPVPPPTATPTVAHPPTPTPTRTPTPRPGFMVR
jgi:hypothetical protein